MKSDFMFDCWIQQADCVTIEAFVEMARQLQNFTISFANQERNLEMEVVEKAEEAIIDWMYRRNGTGHYIALFDSLLRLFLLLF